MCAVSGCVLCQCWMRSQRAELLTQVCEDMGEGGEGRRGEERGGEGEGVGEEREERRQRQIRRVEG